MRILFDHNLPHKLRANLGQHEINGELLLAAEDSGIDIFITGDRSLIYEQNRAGRRLAIIALSTKQLADCEGSQLANSRRD